MSIPTRSLIALLIVLHLTALDARAQPRKIVVDCDPGIDDAIAIALAMEHPALDVVGITTMFGNAQVDQATRNALTIVERSGREVPVYRGAARPLRVPLTKVRLSDAVLQRVRDGNDRYGPFLWSITRFYMDFHKNVERVEGEVYVHDPSAVMYLIDPSLFSVRRGPVRVVTEGIAIGETIMPAYDYQLELPPWRGKPSVTTATDVDVKRFLETFERVMTHK